MPDTPLLDTNRQAQCLTVMALMQTEGLSLKEACERANITPRIFRYWRNKEENLQVAQTLVRTAALDALMEAVEAYPKVVARLIHLATTETGVEAKDQLRAIGQLIKMVGQVPALGQGAPEPPEAGPAEFEPNWLGDSNIDVTVKIRPGVLESAQALAPLEEFPASPSAPALPAAGTPESAPSA